MPNKGQIVEIPASSPVYQEDSTVFHSEKERLTHLTQKPDFTLFSGILIGGHDGIENFRIGQRKGLNLSGSRYPLYVIAIDEKENRVFVGGGKNHPGLFSKAVFIPDSEITWHEDHSFLKEDFTPVKAEISEENYDNSVNVTLYKNENGLFIEFEHPIKNNSNPLTINININKRCIASTAIKNSLT